MGERTTKVTLTAQAQGYISEMQKATQVTRETGSEAEKLAQKSEAFEKMGRSAMVAGGAMAAGLALSAKAAIDWDSAWAGVTKTVDGTPAQMAAVEQGLRDLSGVLPASHDEIAAVAEAAGQLGIETPNVVAFTRTMLDLGETTNLTSTEAATQLARFVNVMGTSQDQVSNLGSTIVDLGNNYATTEAEILAMAQRLSGAGVQIGMSEGQVLGLSTALSSVGIEAEAGGSAMSKVMIDIASSVDKGGERVEQFAKVAGMSAEDFSAKWKTAPGEALAAFVKGLANAEAQGKSTFGILEELGITEVRMRDALLRSASAADQFSAAMAQGDEAFESNTALSAEAEKRYETTAAKLGMMRNKVVDAAITMGEQLLPALESVADSVGGFADMLAGLDGPMAGVAAWGGVLAAGILLTGGVAMAAVPKIAAYKVAMASLNITGASVRGKLGGIASFLGGPWGIALGLAAVSVQGFNTAMESTQVSSENMTNALKQNKSAFDEMLGAAKSDNGFTDFLLNNTENVKKMGDVLDNVADNGNNWWADMFARNTGQNNVIGDLEELGTSLQQLSATDMPSAQRAFKQFYDKAGLNGKQAMTALNDTMPGFKSSLIDAAKAAGLATDDATLLKFAMGEIGPAAQEGAAGADSQKSSLEDLAGVASKTSEEVSALADEIKNFGSDAFDMEGAAVKLQDEFQKLADIFAEGGGSLDITTAAGRDTVTALMDMAAAANQSAGATLKMTGDQEAANAILADTRQRIIDARVALGEDPEAAARWADSLVSSSAAVQESMSKVGDAVESVPTEKIVKIDADTVDAYKGIEGVQVVKIDGKTVYVYGETADAQAKIDAIVAQQIPGKATVVSANDAAFWQAWFNIQQAQMADKVVNIVQNVQETFSSLGKSKSSADGNIFAYANGGISTGIYSGGAPIHKFAEPETGWEAYISGKPSERDRNRQIWAETGSRLGMDEVLKALTGRSGGKTVNMGGVNFVSQGERNQLRDLEDAMHRELRGF